MAEDVVSVAETFMVFMKVQWSIIANLFKASSTLHGSQAAGGNFDQKYEKSLADVDEAISLSISTFNEIISEIGEYRKLSEDAFAFLKDDLMMTISVSEQIANDAEKGYTEGFKGGLTILKSKLDEIKQKVDRHLKTQEEE